MKVTKLIREYVEEQVSKAYDARNNPYAEQAELDRQKLEDFKKMLHEHQRWDIDNFFAENTVLDGWNSYKPCIVHTTIPGFSRCVTPAMRCEEDWHNENTAAKKAKIREIMLNLELGATRKELDEMLAKVLEEV